MLADKLLSQFSFIHKSVSVQCLERNPIQSGEISNHPHIHKKQFIHVFTNIRIEWNSGAMTVKNLMTNSRLNQKVDHDFYVSGFVFFGYVAVFNLLPDNSRNLPKT